MIINNGDRNVEELKDALKSYTLDPRFEKYGDFINRNPQWEKPELNEQYKGCTTLFGNFLTLSHAFNIITDDEELIKEIEYLVNENKKRSEYQEAKNRNKGLFINKEATYQDSVYVDGRYDGKGFSFTYYFSDESFKFSNRNLIEREEDRIKEEWKKHYFIAYGE